MKNLEKLADASDSDLFKELGISAHEAKNFEQGARYLFGEHEKAKEPVQKLEIRAHKPGHVSDEDIRPRP